MATYQTFYSIAITNVSRNQKGDVNVVEICFFNKQGEEIIKMRLDALEARLLNVNSPARGMELVLSKKEQ